MKKFISLLSAFITAFSFSIAAFASGSSSLPVSTINGILDDFRSALKNGDSYVSLSDYNIYDDSGGSTQSELFGYFIRVCSDLGSFTFGKYSETYVVSDFDTDPSTKKFKGVKLTYPDRYTKPDGSCDMTLLNSDKELIANRYREAKNVVNSRMNDVEKALALYDFVITCANYSDPEGTDYDGNDTYTDSSYMAIGLLRDGYGVCAAYAKLYALLLNDCGIPAVTVYCESINHEWVMLKVDNEWYHADPTWDDDAGSFGMTAYYEANEDSWDIGAATHRYFLKSDEEIKELEHPDWELSYTVNPDMLSDPPVSGPSGEFKGKFFDCPDNGYVCVSPMSFINGYWYFPDYNTSSLVITQYDGSPELIPCPDKDDSFKYSFGYGNNLYLSTLYSVYRFDTLSRTFSKIMEIPEDARETDCYTEVRVVFDEMTLITGHYTFEDENKEYYTDFSSSEQTFDMKELETKEPLSAEIDRDISTATRDTDADGQEIDESRISDNLTPADKSSALSEKAKKMKGEAIIFLTVAVIVAVICAASIIIALVISKRR